MKHVLSLLLSFIMLSVTIAFAEIVYDQSEVEDDYMTIKSYYDNAIASPAYAREEFEDLIAYYTEFPEREAALNNYEDALRYLYYARARVAIDNADYVMAREYLKLCRSFGENWDGYMSLAEGMYYKQINQYALAIEKLEAAQSLTELSGMITVQIDECYTLYIAQIKELAASYCADNNHEKAQEYYTMLMIDLGQSEGLTLLNACIAHSSGESPALDPLQILSVSPLSESEIEVQWSGEAAVYQIRITANLTTSSTPSVTPVNLTMNDGLANCAWPEDIDVTGTAVWSIEIDSERDCYYATLSGLLPSTTYNVCIMSGDNSAVVAYGQGCTMPAVEFSMLRAVSGTVWRYDHRAYLSSVENATPGASIFSLLKARNKVTRCTDNVINLSTSSIRNQGVFLNISTESSQMSSLLEDKTVTIVLAVKDTGVVTTSYCLFSENAELYGMNKISLRLDDLFATAISRFGSLSGKAYSISIYVDKQMLYLVEGSIE